MSCHRRTKRKLLSFPVNLIDAEGRHLHKGGEEAEITNTLVFGAIFFQYDVRRCNRHYSRRNRDRRYLSPSIVFPLMIPLGGLMHSN